MLLKGKVVLITGAARGIGRATAKILSEQGAKVGVADILDEVSQTADEIEKAGGKSHFAVFDISDPNQVKGGVQQIRDQLGDIDILVNNAGIVTNIARLTKMSIDAWQQEINVNLSGAFYLIKEVIPQMVEKKWGRIINMSSGAATGGLHRQVGYASSKAAPLNMHETVSPATPFFRD
jgi:NAD(P)-dependent dehydrogenase (short-subunit alcohol dehydrogenase family)